MLIGIALKGKQLLSLSQPIAILTLRLLVVKTSNRAKYTAFTYH